MKRFNAFALELQKRAAPFGCIGACPAHSVDVTARVQQSCRGRPGMRLHPPASISSPRAADKPIRTISRPKQTRHCTLLQTPTAATLAPAVPVGILPQPPSRREGEAAARAKADFHYFSTEQKAFLPVQLQADVCVNSTGACQCMATWARGHAVLAMRYTQSFTRDGFCPFFFSPMVRKRINCLLWCFLLNLPKQLRCRLCAPLRQMDSN
jgi:hypothetical protein